MSSAVATRDPRRAPVRTREMLALVLGPATCHTCLEPLGSPLHRELCEVSRG